MEHYHLSVVDIDTANPRSREQESRVVCTEAGDRVLVLPLVSLGYETRSWHICYERVLFASPFVQTGKKVKL